MNTCDFEELTNAGPSEKSTKNSAKKRCWREIEAIKDKMRLQQELRTIDLMPELESSFDY